MKEAAEMIGRQCLWSSQRNTEKEYLECCSKPESACTIESRPDFPSPYYELIGIGVTLLIILLVICGFYFAVKKGVKMIAKDKKVSRGVARATLVVQIILLLGWLLWGTFWIYEGRSNNSDVVIFFSIIAVVAWLVPMVVVKVAYWILEGFNEDKSK